MCLGIPGKIEQITDSNPLTRTGKVSFGGIRKLINLSLVEDADEGDYVIVHAGFGISLIDEKEAGRVFEYLKEMGELDDLVE